MDRFSDEDHSKKLGRAHLGLPGRQARRLTALLDEALRLKAAWGVEDEALDRLATGRAAIEACIDQMRTGSGARLPGRRGVPRIEAAMEELCAQGEAPLTEQRLLDAVRALDDARELTMAELWAVPQALRLALIKVLLGAAERTVARGRQCAAAAKWVERPVGTPDLSAASVEYALRRAAEDGAPRARARLESAMARRGLPVAEAVQRAQADRARERMQIENLLSALRMLNELNWRDGFEALSRVERELQTDAAGVYGRMDEESRDAVREQVARIAWRLGVPEAAVARCAADAAEAGEGLAGGVCWWLYDDEGRKALLERMGRRETSLPRLTPDPRGRWTVFALVALAAAGTAALSACAGGAWLWLLCVPLGWACAGALAARLYPLRIAPARLLKLELKAVPGECRTLVVVPALLSSRARTEQVCAQLEALGCLEADPNLEYLLLGDFADAPRRDMPGDDEALACAREAVEAMNRRAGRERYALLVRRRTLLERDGVWMGRDRKRGALEDLNRLLMDEPGAASAFDAEGKACGRLAGRFAYVITLDADTRMLPGEARRLIGAMAHPLNRPRADRGYAVLQPRMEALPSLCPSAFARLFAGPGGVSAYPVSVSSLWQDLTGRGIYAGKGIYDVAAFHARLDGALPQGRILSHDLIEGAIAGAGFVGDVALYDGHPAALAPFLKRLNRWTRGDWQLMPLILSRRLPNGRALSGADRFRMLDNLLRSLRTPAELALLLVAMWTGNGGALLAALAVNYLEPVLSLPRRDGRLWRRATAELALLPALAWCSLDACLRTLWRLAVSGRHLMDWVTAADAEADGEGSRGVAVPGRVAAILLLPGLLQPGWTMASLALAVLFCVAPRWIGGMATEEAEALTAHERETLTVLARDTWRFFETWVPEGDALPPDNVQLEPPTGAARRTSPTNIALYLLSCLSARRLGLLDGKAMTRRLEGTVEALERLEKWRGHLYNWIDPQTLAPLEPRYVSSVDSGNLAAALLACANAPETGAALAARMNALAGNMDFGALYDERRELFAIGMEVHSGRMSASHYDLLASEAWILSYTAMMLGQVSAGHWRRLGRGCVRAGGGVVPLSWSGTMFEYLLPLVFMPAIPHTLLGDGVRAAVAAQRAQGRRLGRPWGVSESGFGALDGALNYQYRAFGLRALAMSGEASESVVAPYASALAAMVAPAAAARNLEWMRGLGWSDDMGMYEAADYLTYSGGQSPTLVKSHMAHHQGMILCALCNTLTEGSLQRDFMGLPHAKALSPLLEERPFEGRPGFAAARRPGELPERPAPRLARRARTDGAVPETHLLWGDGASVLWTTDGAFHYRRHGISATRFMGALRNRVGSPRVTVANADAGTEAALGGKGVSTHFEPGMVRTEAELGAIRATLDACVSPEDGTLVRVVTLRNAGDRPVRCRVTDMVPVALASDGDWQAHACFQCLFVRSQPLAEDALLFSRRPGSRGEGGGALAHLAAGGAVEWETDGDRCLGRSKDGPKPFSGGSGATLNPVSAARVSLEVAPGGSARVLLALSLLDGSDAPGAWLERWREPGRVGRAMRLAAARAGTVLESLGLNGSRQHMLQRLAALLADGDLAARARGACPGEGSASRRQLWPLGLSGDRPLLVMRVFTPGDFQNVRELIRAHAFYRALGMESDLALVDEDEAGYRRPVREMLENLIASTHLNALRAAPGGAWLLDGSALDAAQRVALRRGSAVALVSNRDFYSQVRALLSAMESAYSEPLRAMAVGASILGPQARLGDNGYGGFLPGGGYGIDVRPERLPPAPWCNILANEFGGVLLSERGGGFAWQGNSRMGRLTPYGNDPLDEGWGWTLALTDAAGREALGLLPGKRPQIPFRVRFDASGALYAFENRRAAGEVRFAMAADRAEIIIDVELENRAMGREAFCLTAGVDWLLGEDRRDAVWLNAWHEDGACLATGACGGAGYLAAGDWGALPGPEAGHGLRVPIRLGRGERRALRLALGWAASVDEARSRAREVRRSEAAFPQTPPPRMTIETPDEALNHLVNDFLLHQARSARVLGRTGLYQPGGAWGFRDQLQDMLALMHAEPGLARTHLLRCAARQFEAGDVLHWWHEPTVGVRTHVSDDLLFLPYVTAEYVKLTGDASVLLEAVPWLENVDIPVGREDLYGEMKLGSAVETLHGHCMRAFRRADRRGNHGLLRMGAGDWNDGMNRVGAEGRGESVWLTQFAIACADSYRQITPVEADRVWLWRLGEELRAAAEAHGWDGEWYLRAYDDDGLPLGSAQSVECRIDAISQAWAVLAGLDVERCRRAMDAAWAHLVDEPAGLIRLLTPPFEGRGRNPGYIRGYPAGVRENGGQYTHGALWLLLALIRMGDGARAHKALQMLLPFNHALTSEAVQNYRVEPYVMAADVYDAPGHRGRGGWTWYTGAAGWMYTCILALLGYERRGDRVRLNALLGNWPRASVTLPFGKSSYRLTCDKTAQRVMLDGAPLEDDFVTLWDDGSEHEVVFPERKG